MIVNNKVYAAELIVEDVYKFIDLATLNQS